MKQRLTIIVTAIIVVGVLVILNSLTFVKKDKPRDLEAVPDRSTYHSGPTGTRALYDLLNESGYRVMRWRESTEKLLSNSGDAVTTFVVIGSTKVEFTEEEATSLLGWVQRGGRFVLIDRRPEETLLPKSGNWKLATTEGEFPPLTIDPADQKQMTETVTALQPAQPTLLTQEIQAVMPSRFASRIRVSFEESIISDEIHKISKPQRNQESKSSPAPVVHFADKSGAFLVDYEYGRGTITLLSDPYFISNGGISLNDNVQLALNIVGGHSGLIAFDEFHQGKVTSQNAIAGYFAGTPILPIVAQLLVLLLLFVWTRARRFARPLPLAQVDRRSTLEFVASMSELQERAKAYDLAIENIYSRTRRVLARYAGVDYNTPRAEIASRVAARSSVDEQKLATLMRQCEEAINGEPISWRQSLDLVRRLREVERTLGLRMRSRDVRQAAENI